MKIGSRNIILIVISAVILAGAFALAEYRNSAIKKVVYTSQISSPTTDVLSEVQKVDSDSDGLKDWEEVLLGTDPKNPDTDADKTPDGQEVTLGRNPLVKGPKDDMKTIASSTISVNEKLTQTDILARDFFARYMELQQMGLSSDKDSQNVIIGQVLKSGLILATPKTYTLKDLIIYSDNSKEAIKKYGNDVGAIFKNNNPVNSRNEAAIAKDSLEKEDPSILKEIDPIITAYKKINSSLLKTRVPDTMANIHIDLVNSMSSLLFTAESLRKSGNDAVSSIQGVNLYPKAAQALNMAFNNLKASFIASGVTFGESEPGSFFIPQKP